MRDALEVPTTTGSPVATATSSPDDDDSDEYEAFKPSGGHLCLTVEGESAYIFRNRTGLQKYDRKVVPTLWVIAGIAMLITVLVSAINIGRHLLNFNLPQQQIYVVRILFLAPIYSLSSFLAFRYYADAVYIFTLRDCYEAIAINAFFQLLLQYMGQTPHVQRLALMDKPTMRYPFPLMWLGHFNPSHPSFPRNVKAMVLQYVVVKPTMTLMAVVLAARNRFCQESLNPRFGHFWYIFLNFVSVGICMTGLLVMIGVIKNDISEHKPYQKLLVFFLVVQTALLASLSTAGVLRGSTLFSPTNQANAYNSFITCLEMVLLSAYNFFAFSAKEYMIDPSPLPPTFSTTSQSSDATLMYPFDGKSDINTPLTAGTAPPPHPTLRNGPRRTSPLRALMLALNPIDVFREVWHSIIHVQRLITGAAYRRGRRSHDMSQRRGPTTLMPPMASDDGAGTSGLANPPTQPGSVDADEVRAEQATGTPWVVAHAHETEEEKENYFKYRVHFTTKK
ncbi:hypothetical protein HDU96_002013 [Phlyctochytrium bullatum]|nr:hypothetical protein HDU96_002013 [Phlyctochytrium bullatum]